MNNIDLLDYFVPYKFQDENTIINSITSKLGEEEPAKKRTMARRLIKTLENKKYITKKVLYLKSNRSTKEKSWAIDNYENSKRHARETGYVVYVLTKSGYQEFLKSAADCPLTTMLRDLFTPDLQWTDPSKRSSHYNYQRMRASIYTYMNDAGITTSKQNRCKAISGIEEGNESPKTVADTIRIATGRTMCLIPENAANHFSTSPTLYMKEEVLTHTGKNAYKDNILALIVTAHELFPIYHTSDYYGSAWLTSSKKETITSLSNFAFALSLSAYSVTRALIFASTPKEFADLILTSHNIHTNTIRYFGPYKSRSIGTKILGQPYDHLYAVPECEATAQQINYLMTADPNSTIEDTLADSLLAFDSEAEYFEMMPYAQHITPIETALTIPEDTAERAIFLTELFRWGVFLNGNDREATPVADCRDMDLRAISRAYYFYAETSSIGNIVYKTKKFRNIIIICFNWQINWLKKLFENAIFLCV